MLGLPGLAGEGEQIVSSVDRRIGLVSTCFLQIVQIWQFAVLEIDISPRKRTFAWSPVTSHDDFLPV